MVLNFPNEFISLGRRLRFFSDNTWFIGKGKFEKFVKFRISGVQICARYAKCIKLRFVAETF